VYIFRIRRSPKTFLQIYEFFENPGNNFKITKKVSGSGRIQKLSKTFLQIYEFFENPGNNFKITKEVSGSGRFPKCRFWR
jgi:hypothetical protein